MVHIHFGREGKQSSLPRPLPYSVNTYIHLSIPPTSPLLSKRHNAQDETGTPSSILVGRFQLLNPPSLLFKLSVIFQNLYDKVKFSLTQLVSLDSP